MKRIKLLFGSALALVLALSLFVPATVSAEETGTTPVDTTVTPTAATYTMDQIAFDAAYPEGVKQGEVFNIGDYYDGDVTELALVGYTGSGFVFWEIDETYYTFVDGDIWVYAVGDVDLTFEDELGATHTLSFNVVENPVDIVLDPTDVKLPVGESTTILIDTIPEDAWWFWAELADEGSNGVMIETTISDTSVISVEKAYDEDGNWIGYTVKGLKEGKATISIETELGHVSVATIEVFDKQILQPPTTTTKPSTEPAPAASNNGGPATGDTTNTTMYMLMMLAALASVSGYAFLKKQK